MPSVGRLRYLEALPSGAAAARPRGVLVLLHAFPLNARMWEDQLVMAERGWRVLVPQFRGFDTVSVEPAVSSMDDYAGDIIDLLDALHIKQAVISGLSMGGYVAFAMLRLAARYIHALILADTKPQADTPDAVAARRRMLEMLEAKGASAIADEMLPKLLGDTTLAARPQIVDQVRSLVLANASDGIAGAIRALISRQDSVPLLASIHVPTLIIVGDEDRVTPRPLSEAMQQAIPGSELVVIGGAGHLSNLEQPAAFNLALTRFLDHRV
ncbi:MAG TPA: alpha/beta fold hydrolase [Vicinamibacterales bacterium]